MANPLIMPPSTVMIKTALLSAAPSCYKGCQDLTPEATQKKELSDSLHTSFVIWVLISANKRGVALMWKSPAIWLREVHKNNTQQASVCLMKNWGFFHF